MENTASNHALASCRSRLAQWNYHRSIRPRMFPRSSYPQSAIVEIEPTLQNPEYLNAEAPTRLSTTYYRDMDPYSTGSWHSPDVDMSFQWCYPTMQSPKTMVNHYNELLQRAADFYSTLGGSPCDSQPTSGSDLSYRCTPERRVSASVVAQVKKSIPDKIERRREQNRSSQRAYRERKERHQRDLERQISEWQHKHQLLSRSYGKQSEEVTRLKTQIEQLNAEIIALHNGLPSLCGSLNQSPTEFDLVPFFDHEGVSPSSPKSHNAFSRL